MQVVKSYPDGIFCWIDLTTTDADGAKAFYGGLFGWEFDDRPTDMGPVYTMCQIEGYDVAGLSQLSPDMQAQDMPPFWSSYVKHSDVDAVAARISENGGNLMMPVMDVMESGRMTVATDPTGAAFGVWQPKEHIGAQLVNRPNALVWNELQTHGVEAAQSFYAAVFGWTYQTDENGYVMVSQDGRMQAGMMQIQEAWGDVPPNWGVYFMVENIETAVAKAKELGGTILVPISKAGEIGEFAVIQDPQGAVFTAMSFQGKIDPPPGY
jgi:predicted enzyme related to lactoylglutathione lyase